MAAPVRNPDAVTSLYWRDRYLGVIDYSAIVRWVLESAGVVAVALLAGSTTAAGVGVGVVGALGAVVLGATGPAAVVGIAAAAGVAAVAGGATADKCRGKDALTAADKLGDDFYKVILQGEPFKSTTVWSIIKSYRWAPFISVAMESSMLSVLLLLSKYKLRNVPVIESGKADIKNFITQSAVVQGLEKCKGRDWFDCITTKPISDMGLPFMSSEEVVTVRTDGLILEAFMRMKDNQIGGLPVVEGPQKKIVGNVSIRDIRHLLLKPKLFHNLRHFTEMDFIKTVASTSEENSKVMTPITCKVDASLGSVIDRLALHSIHRIHVVSGDEQSVVGVITLRDVISCFISEPPGHFDNYFGFPAKEMLDK